MLSDFVLVELLERAKVAEEFAVPLVEFLFLRHFVKFGRFDLQLAVEQMELALFTETVVLESCALLLELDPLRLETDSRVVVLRFLFQVRLFHLLVFLPHGPKVLNLRRELVLAFFERLVDVRHDARNLFKRLAFERVHLCVLLRDVVQSTLRVQIPDDAFRSLNVLEKSIQIGVARFENLLCAMEHDALGRDFRELSLHFLVLVRFVAERVGILLELFPLHKLGARHLGHFGFLLFELPLQRHFVLLGFGQFVDFVVEFFRLEVGMLTKDREFVVPGRALGFVELVGKVLFHRVRDTIPLM